MSKEENAGSGVCAAGVEAGRVAGVLTLSLEGVIRSCRAGRGRVRWSARSRPRGRAWSRGGVRG